MKPSVDAADTRRVLADIEDAVRPVEMARTAAAVERVLCTASPGLTEPAAGSLVTLPLYEQLGIPKPYRIGCDRVCACYPESIPVDHLPGMAVAFMLTASEAVFQHSRYAPWVVSPHLFGEGT